VVARSVLGSAGDFFAEQLDSKGLPMTKKQWTIIGVLGAAVVTISVCIGCLVLSVLVSSLPQNESMPTNQTPVPKLIAPPTLALRLTETSVPIPVADRKSTRLNSSH
jgi:hypothetical protein